MSDHYELIHWLHILSATILFGTGLGSAFHMAAAHWRGGVDGIALVTRNVVLADYLFIATTGLFQPLSGIALILAGGFDPWSGWLLASYALYGLAMLCWFAAVWVQIRLRDVAQAAAQAGAPLPDEYHRLFRIWFALGWPAFLALIAVFWLMAAKPEL